MTRIQCPLCRERMPEHLLKEHTLGLCKASAKTYVYLKHALRPFPDGHTLPEWLVPIASDLTRCSWEGEPREAQPLLPTPTMQHWVPRWVDIIVELWVGSIYLEGGERKTQRDLVLAHVLQSPKLQRDLIDAYAEDLRAVRDHLKACIVGPLPQLLSEVHPIHAEKSLG